MRLTVSALLTLLLCISVSLAAHPLEGAWSVVQYHLKDGQSLEVSGQILFAANHWSVLFFVTEGGEPKRGSAEGGTYRVEGDKLIFLHTLRLADIDRGSESPIVREIKAEPTREATQFEVQGRRLTIDFPSGNRMVFQKPEEN